MYSTKPEVVYVSVSGSGVSQATTSTPYVPTAELITLEPNPDIPPLQPPPPLPPRRQKTNRDSTSSASSDVFRSGSPEPPRVPPRTDQPPPVPPRRDSMYNTNTNSASRGQTLSHPPRTPTLVSQSRTVSGTARTLSASQPPTALVQNQQVYSATLPRYFGDRDSVKSDDNIFNFNGENSDIPALPPKPYRSHSRKQSS